MKKTLIQYRFGFTLLMVIFVLAGCKSDSDESSNKVLIDISGLKSKLVAASSPSSAPAQSGVSQSGIPVDDSSPAQTPVTTLIITPIIFTNHGKPYSTDEPFTDAVADDMEKDAPNSIDFIKFIDLSGSENTVEVEVPNISDGWQLLAAASKVPLENVDDMTKEENDNALAYVGFTEDYYVDAEDFESKNPTLTLKRACYQDELPKGCAVYEDNGQANVSSAVEIQGIEINGIAQSPSPSFPWVVRESPTGDEISVTNAENYMETVYSTFSGTKTTAKVTTTHQLSKNQPSACSELTTAATTTQFTTECGTQEYSITFNNN